MAQSAFGELLRHKRAARQLTQEALAERAGLSVRAISDLERGLKRPHWSTLNLLVAALGLDATEAGELNVAARSNSGMAQVEAAVEPTRRTNVPAELSSFIGRDWEVAQIRQLLEGSRLLTLTGPGGVGKTRLAMRLATEMLSTRRYPDGVWFVELAGLKEARLVPNAVASALNVAASPRTAIIDSLRAQLGERHVLLVLDNCEHLVDACAHLIEYLLRGCHWIDVLATSREPLCVSGETVWRVPALAVPHGSSASVEELAACAAIQLFVERARAVRWEFALTPQNAPDVAAICRQLDGLPLALELAAARVSVLSTHEIRARLHARFASLSTNRRTAEPRQRSLLATLDWSYELLTLEERLLLDQLAVFQGGFTLEAVEQVCTTKPIPGSEVVDILGRLIDKSLVHAEPESNGTLRYRLHETVRQFGLEHLTAADTLTDVREAHARHYSRMARLANGELKSGGQPEWLNLLEREHDNMRAALTWSIATGSAETGFRLGAGLWRFWQYRAYLLEAEEWLSRLLALPPSESSDWIAMLFGAGRTAITRGDMELASTRFQQLLEVATRQKDADYRAAALTQLGQTARDMNQFDRARALYSEALQIRRETRDSWGTAATLALLANLTQMQGDLTSARAMHLEVLELFQSIPDEVQVSQTLADLGFNAAMTGDFVLGRRYLRDALTRWHALGHLQGIAVAFDRLGRLAIRDGDAASGARLLGASSHLRHSIGMIFTWLPQPEEDPGIASARRALGDSAYEAHFNSGERLTLEMAIHEALNDAGPTRRGGRRPADTDTGPSERSTRPVPIQARERAP